MAHNCDTCVNFMKVNTFRDGRKGICAYTDYNIVNMKGKPCPYYEPKKYYMNKRKSKNKIESNYYGDYDLNKCKINHKFKVLTKDEINKNRSNAYEYSKLK